MKNTVARVGSPACASIQRDFSKVPWTTTLIPEDLLDWADEDKARVTAFALAALLYCSSRGGEVTRCVATSAELLGISKATSWRAVSMLKEIGIARDETGTWHGMRVPTRESISGWLAIPSEIVVDPRRKPIDIIWLARLLRLCEQESQAAGGEDRREMVHPRAWVLRSQYAVATKLGTSRNTTHKAIQRLAELGYVDVRGQGVNVQPHMPRQLGLVGGIVQALRGQADVVRLEDWRRHES